MANVMICVPTLDSVSSSFFTSFVGLRYDDGHRYNVSVLSNSLIYNARGDFANQAIHNGMDYMIMLDSDMVFGSHIVKALTARIEETGADLVTGLYFRRRLPTSPLIYGEVDWYENELFGAQQTATVYEEWPDDDVFPVEGCGLGLSILRVKTVEELAITFRMNPFTPMPRLSEDLAFSWRLKQLRKTVLCDQTIRALHAGLHLYGEPEWQAQVEQRKEE